MISWKSSYAGNRNETEYNKKAFDQSQIDTVGIVTKESGLAKYLVVDNDFIYEILRK